MDPNIFLTIFLSVPMSTGYVFLFCAVGSLTTVNYIRFADASFDSQWFRFPVDLQKYLLLIISSGQRPLLFRGLRIINLDLMAFTQVSCIFIFILKKHSLTFLFLGDENCRQLLFVSKKHGQMKKFKRDGILNRQHCILAIIE